MSSRRVALIVTIVLAAVVFIGGFVVALASPTTNASPSPAAQLVRSNSQVLDAGGDNAVTVVEFLDFECEACGAMNPVVDQLRQEFRDRITYVVRYFPLAGHFNSGAAALAAQAAADQGQFEPMFRRLFETQANWGEDKVSRADEFRGFAQDLSLDMGRYDASIADPKTQQRIQIDLNDGQALGVRGTPTFFVDGKEVELTKTTDLRDAIVRALEAKS